MKVFIFQHPRMGSQYVGMWAVRAEDAQHAGVLAWEYHQHDEEYMKLEAFQQAALEGQSLELAVGGHPLVLDCFLT